MASTRDVVAIENSIRMHGILLEHESKMLLDSGLSALGAPPKLSTLSKCLISKDRHCFHKDRQFKNRERKGEALYGF